MRIPLSLTAVGLLLASWGAASAQTRSDDSIQATRRMRRTSKQSYPVYLKKSMLRTNIAFNTRMVSTGGSVMK